MSPDSSSSQVAWRHERLSNGAELLVLRQPWAQEAGLCLRVAAGSHDEPEQYPGLAHFLEHMLFRGSHGYGPADSLMAYMQEQGGQVNASTRAHHTDFVCALPASRIQPVLSRLVDMLRWPLLEPAAQASEREVLHAEYQARSADADLRIDHALAQGLASGHRCSAFLAGNRNSLPVEQDDFQRALHGYHQAHFRAATMRLVLVGPQPLEQLLALAQQAMAQLPASDTAPLLQCPALLPLRARRLHLQQPAGSVHLGLVVQLCGQDEALALVLDTLADPAPGGLLDDLRQAGLCQALNTHVLYHHGQHCLLRMDFPGGRAGQLATLRAALQCWLQQAGACADWAERVRQWQRVRACRQLAAAPLVLARELSAAWPPLQAPDLLDGVQQVLARLAASDTFIELVADPQPQPNWPAVGLDLPLRSVASHGRAAWPRRVGLPAGEPLLEGGISQRLPAVQLHWGQAAVQGGPAALYWRAGAVVPGVLADTRQLQARCQRLGVNVLLEVHDGGWQLRLQGPAQLLPACSLALLARLSTPVCEPVRPVLPAMPIRQLLEMVPRLAADMGWNGPLQCLGVGLQVDDRERLMRAFERCTTSLDQVVWTRPRAGLHWQQVAAPGEAALLLFCPLPDAEARTEAAWRLLGQWLAGAFHRRLRDELHLGYALFAGFRQLGGRRGLLFALQSPVCDASQVLRHFADFFTAQSAAAALLDAAALQRLRDGLRDQLAEPLASPGLAERLWQAHVAGLAEDHARAVHQCLAVLEVADLRHACEQLRCAQGGWRVLANAPQANL